MGNRYGPGVSSCQQTSDDNLGWLDHHLQPEIRGWLYPVPSSSSSNGGQARFLVFGCHTTSTPITSALYGRKVAGLIWIRFDAEALRFSVAKLSRPPLKMGKCKAKSTIISRFKSFQVCSTQKPGIQRPHPDVDDGNGGTLTSTKDLNGC